MLASSALVLGGAILGLLTSIVGASACIYNSFRTSKMNLSLLKTKAYSLENLIDKLQQKLNGVDVLKEDPSPWIEKAKESLTSINFSDFESYLTENCANGGVCNLSFQCGAAWLVEQKIAAIDSLVADGKQLLERITVKGSKQPDVSIAGSREVIRENIWRQISDEEGADVVCIHGVAGVGKTAMAAVIHNQALVQLKSFEDVLWVNIEYGLGLRHVQDEIARKLHRDLSVATDNAGRAGLIESALSQKKFLLVLDSMWQPLPLRDIGIPVPARGSKLIVTSGNYAVCRKVTSRIKSKEFYEIKPINHDEEAWDLFNGEIGSAILRNLGTETLDMARLAVESLDGIPVAIKLLAEALGEIHNDIPKELDASWKEELKGLGKSTSIVGSKGKELIDCFKSSIANLDGIQLSCLTYFGLFPMGHLIKSKELIEYWLSEELLGPVSSLQESVKRGKDILTVLKDSHIVESVREKDGEESVKVLNVVRFVAMSFLVESGHRFYDKCGTSLNVFPSVTDWPKEVERASFIQNNIPALGGIIPNCKKLSTLLLQENPLNSSHYAKFFSNMPNLKVLDLSRTGISSLPMSLAILKNLRALFLRHCSHLKSLPTLSNLQKLIILDLFGTPLGKAPEGMSSLTELRRLDLAFLNTQVFKNYVTKTEQSPYAPCNFRVYVGGSFDGGTLSENSVIVIDDYQVMVPEMTRELYLMMYSEPVTSIKLDGHFWDLHVVDISDFDGISYLFTIEMLVCLKRLRKVHVKRCKKMLGIIQPAEDVYFRSITLPELTELVLLSLPKLENICHAEMLICPCLRKLKVWNCDNLKLPDVFGPKTGHIEITGDRKWGDKVKDASHRLKPDCKFNEASVPEELSSTPRVMKCEPGATSIKRQEARRRFALPTLSRGHPDPRPGGATNYAITLTNQRKTENIRRLWDIVRNFVTRSHTSSSTSLDDIEILGSLRFEDGKFPKGLYRSDNSRSNP